MTSRLQKLINFACNKTSFGLATYVYSYLDSKYNNGDITIEQLNIMFRYTKLYDLLHKYKNDHQTLMKKSLDIIDKSYYYIDQYYEINITRIGLEICLSVKDLQTQEFFKTNVFADFEDNPPSFFYKYNIYEDNEPTGDYDDGLFTTNDMDDLDITITKNDNFLHEVLKDLDDEKSIKAKLNNAVEIVYKNHSSKELPTGHRSPENFKNNVLTKLTKEEISELKSSLSCEVSSLVNTIPLSLIDKDESYDDKDDEYWFTNSCNTFQLIMLYSKYIDEINKHK